MADALIPGAVVNANPTDIPIDSQPVGFGAGLQGAFGAAMRSGPGSSLETQMIGKFEGGQALPYDTVKKIFEDQKLDPTVFPKGQPISQGEAIAVMGQQLKIQRDQDLAQRAHLGTASQWIAGAAGSFADPAGLALGLIGGPLLGAAGKAVGAGRAVTTGAGLATRVITGGAEGAAGAAAFREAEKHFGSAQGDRDITSGQILQDAMWGSVVGGALKGGFGERPSTMDMHGFKQMIIGAEDSVGYAKAHGIDPDHVVSNKNAVGLFQITPDLAKSLGFSGDIERLKDHDYNEQVAEANFEKLYKKYGNDPEAIAVAWNGGPGMADRFIKAGRDRNVLPKETRDYLAKIDKLNGREPPVEGAPPAAPGAAPEPLPEGAVQVRGYHGTNADYQDYNEGKLGTSSFATDAKSATFFSSDPDVAAGYANFAASNIPTESADLAQFNTLSDANRAEGFTGNDARRGQNIRPVDITFRNPAVIDWKGEMYSQTGFQKAILKAKADGHDGVVFKNVNDDVSGNKKLSDVYASFHPNDAAKTAFGVRGMPDKTDIAVAKTAVAQAANGSEINVDPIIKAVREMDHNVKPSEDWKQVIPTARLSELANADAKAALEKVETAVKNSPKGWAINETFYRAEDGAKGREPHPAVAEIQKLAKDDIAAVASMHTGLTGEGSGAENSFEKYMKREDEKFAESEGAEAQPEFQKALEAAVQCGLKKGTE